MESKVVSIEMLPCSEAIGLGQPYRITLENKLSFKRMRTWRDITPEIGAIVDIWEYCDGTHGFCVRD